MSTLKSAIEQMIVEKRNIPLTKEQVSELPTGPFVTKCPIQVMDEKGELTGINWIPNRKEMRRRKQLIKKLIKKQNKK